MANVHHHRARDCCEKSSCEKGNKYDTDELKSYIRKQKELRRVRELQEFEERARILECKKQRLRELDNKCKQLATKKSTSPHQAPTTTTRPTKGSTAQIIPGPNYAPSPHSTKSLEKTTTGGQVTTAKPKIKRSKEQQTSGESSSVRKVKSSNKLEREAADFIFREFEQIVRRECRSLLKKQGLVSGSESSISLTSEARNAKVQRERRPEKEKVLKVDKNVGTSFSLYETIPPHPASPSRAPKESPSRISNFSEDAKPVASSKGFHSLVDERNERRLKIQQQRPPVPESVKNEAASKIQAAYKGYKVRSVLCEANLRGPTSSQVDPRVSNTVRSPSSDSVLQGNKMKFFTPHRKSNLTNGVCSATSLQKPEKPYDQKARFPVTSFQGKSLPIKPNIDEIPGYIPPPPRSIIAPSRAPELSPRTVPLLRLRNPDEPFPKQVIENQPSQQNLSATSSPLKLITSISKFQLPYALQSPCSKDVPSNLLRTALKQQVEQPYKSPSQFPATTRISRPDSKDGQRPVFRSKPNVANAIPNLPDPAFSTVLQEKIKLLQNQHRIANGSTPKKSKSPTKRSQMTAVSKATEQIKKKIVEAKQILEDYKLELLRTSPASRMSHGDDTYESDFDSESHAISQRQVSLYGNDSEILSSLGDRGVELIPRPPNVGSGKEPQMNDDVSSKAETQPSSSLRGIASLKSRRSGDEIDFEEEKQTLEGTDQVPVREQTTSRPGRIEPGGDQIMSQTKSTKVKAREIKLVPTPKEVFSMSEEVGLPPPQIRIPSTVTLRRKDTTESEESLQGMKQQERWKGEPREDRANETPKFHKTPQDLEFRNHDQQAEMKLAPTSEVPIKKSEEEVESEESKTSEVDTDYEDLAPSVSKASTNIATEDVMYETDFETDWQSLTQSKPHHSLIVQKGGVRYGESDVNTQTSLSLSLTDQPPSKSAAIQIDLPSDSVSLKIDQEVQSEEQTDDKLIEDEAPSVSVTETPEVPTGDTKKEFEDHAVESAALSVATSVGEQEYGTDFETEGKTASVSEKPASIVTASVPLELVGEAKDETIAEEYSGVSYKEDTFVNGESKDDIDEYPSVQSLREENSVSESSVVVEEAVTTPSKEATSPESQTEDPKMEVAPEDPASIEEDPIEDLATSVSSNVGISSKSVIASNVQAVEEAADISYSDSTKFEQEKIEPSVTVGAVHTGRISQTEEFSHISEEPEPTQSQISEASFLSETKSTEKKSVSVSAATSQYEASRPEQVRSAQKSDALSVQSQTEKIEHEKEEKFTENYSQVLNESQEIGIQAGISEQEPPTPLRNGAKFLEDVSFQSEISEELPDSDEDEEGTEEEKDMIELAKKVDSDIFEKIESLIASEISGQFERENEDSEATGVESRQSNFHVEDVVYASDFEADVQSEKSGDASSRRSLLETAVKQEVELLVQNIAKEEKTGEGDSVVQHQLRPETDPVLTNVLNDQRALDALIGRIVARMFQEVTKARREAFKTTQKSSSKAIDAAIRDDDEGSSFHGEVDGDAEWFEDDLISGGSPEDESLKREAAEIVAEQLRIENEIRALEALQAQVPATLMSLTDVPDKPPPPYSPPSSDSISLPIRPFSVQITCAELEDLIKKQVKFLLPVWKETRYLPAVCQIEETVAENRNDNEGNQESANDSKESSSLLSPPSGISKRAFNSLLNDLVYELIREALLVEDEDGPHARDYVDRIRPGSLALEAQRMRIPRTEEALSNLVLSKVKNLIPYPILANDVPIPRKRLTKWTSRPRDLVDEVLAEELIDEDREWTECWPEEILVLDRWAEKFTRRALQEVNLAFKTAFSV